MGATPEGKKELITVCDGFHESKQNWSELREVYPKGVAEQRC